MFNSRLWRFEALFRQGGYFMDELHSLARLAQDLPQERFRLSRFLYCEVCQLLRNFKEFDLLKQVVKVCRSISAGPGPQILE